MATSARLADAVRDTCDQASDPAPSDRHAYLQIMIHATMRTHGFVPVEPQSTMLSKQAAAFPVLTYECLGETATLRSMPMFGQLVCYCNFREGVHQLTLRAEDFVHDTGTVMIREHEHLCVGDFILSISALSAKLEAQLFSKLWPQCEMPSLSSIGDNACQQLLSYLDAPSLATLASTCKLFQERAAHPTLWCRLIHRNFPDGACQRVQLGFVNNQACVAGSATKIWPCDKTHQKCAGNSRQQYIGL
jgi:hypothetical protein